ncbi:MAG: histidine kinase [Pseudomonadota bacterium]|nr:histidine kinase [Pseudomonadota bacterium]
MPPILRTLLQPMNRAALLTCLAVALALRAEQLSNLPLMATLLLTYTAALMAVDLVPRRWRETGVALLLATEAACALTLVWLAPRGGTAPVLTVILVAQIVMQYPVRVAVPLVLALDIALYFALLKVGYSEPLIVTLLYGGFQAFAALTAHYAKTAEASRDALALVNADLLATRALLADSARDVERLRVARELHDVAGHKLTAMTLNLRALEADPAFAGRAELTVARQLSGELLGDIRNVVQALRDARGLDLATALRALAAPLPRPRLQLDIDPTLEITDPGLAETVLRMVQEALTNSARHGDAANLHVVLRRRPGGGLHLQVEDDGRARAPLREGNGLAGMRERVESAGGELALSIGARGALRLDASLPL